MHHPLEGNNLNIDENQLAFELYKTKGFVDVYYYRSVTGDTASNATIRERLESATEGFTETDVTYEQFIKDYEFGKFAMLRDWIRFYADKGLRLSAEALFEYVLR